MGNMARNTLAPLVLRLGLAVIFIFHGVPKVGPDASWGTNWMTGNEAPPGVVQLLVAWGEVLGGAALAVGVLTRVAALGIIVIMAGAIATVHGQHGFSLADRGYEYNFALIVMSLAVMLTGSGALGLDHWVWGKKKT